MGSSNKKSRGVKTTQTVFGIIEALEELDGAGVSELAEQLDLAKSTVHDHLTTLEQMEYVVKEDRSYRVSLRFLGHGMAVKRRNKLSQVASSTLEQLAKETEEVAWLYVAEHGMGVLLDKAHGDHAVDIMGSIGLRLHLHAHAGGKAILAFLPEEEKEAIIMRHGLPALTEHTITDKEELEEELAEIRQDGTAYNDGESVTGARALAAPIMPEGTVVGAVGVAGPTNRMSETRINTEISDAVLGVANEIELRWIYED